MNFTLMWWSCGRPICSYLPHYHVDALWPGMRGPVIGRVNRGCLFLWAMRLIIHCAVSKRGNVLMLSTVEGAPGEPTQRQGHGQERGHDTRLPVTICQTCGTAHRALDVCGVRGERESTKWSSSPAFNLFSRALRHVVISSCNSQKPSSLNETKKTGPK